MHSNTEMIYRNTDRPVPVIHRYQQGGGKEMVYNSSFNVFGRILPSVFRMSVSLPCSCQNVFFLPRSHQVIFLFTSFLRVFFCSVQFNDESHVIYFFVPDFFVLVLLDYPICV
jgi:hypothetical protein